MTNNTLAPESIDPVSLIVITLSLLGLGSLLITIAVRGHRGRLRSNHACGVRTRATLTDSAVWYRVHRLVAPWFGCAGVLLLAAVPPFLLLPGGLTRAVPVYIAFAVSMTLVIVGGIRCQRRALRELHTD
ncbi:SdpI/YhfL protein family protein [Actinopolyspora xinjiangensis]|uniref:SdpI/YhfL protein family protein n=1 Tax=Actinopolyspora xinjiangensis TaxID=405564 RepID=A0A1H0X3C6_9ACTN|nr:SdpI family protein [Actinopolyspora xinjiangensis]SDP97390.1 SdpI/YhfL protein family protein [Actinopolyspora xinjiangensis]